MSCITRVACVCVCVWVHVPRRDITSVFTRVFRQRAVSHTSPPRSFSVRHYYYYNNNILFHCDYFARILYFIIMYNDVILCFLLGTAFEIRYRRLFVICSRTACCLHDWAWTRRKHLPFNNSYHSNRQTTLHIIILLYFTKDIMFIGDDS